MSVTSGFFNAKDGDRVYDAFQMSSIFDGIIRDGIFASYGDKLIVKADISDGNRVIVGTGRAWFDHTWTLNDAPIVLPMPAPEAVLKRIDTIVLDVNRNVNSRKNSIIVVKGTPATNPVPTARIKTEEHNQFMLAQILRTPGKKITAADITSTVGTNETPYVTAPIQSISIESLLNQLNTQWSEWWVPFKSSTESQQRAFLQQMQAVITELEEQAQQLMDDQLAIFTAWRTQIEKDYNTWLTNFKAGANKDKLDFNTWIDLQKTEYAAWLAIFKKDADDDKAEFDAWVETQKTAYNAWYKKFRQDADDDKLDFDAWIETQKTEYAAWLAIFKKDANADKLSFDTWIATQKTDYNKWYTQFRKDADADKLSFDDWIEAQKTEYATWLSTFKTAADKDATDFETWMAGRKVTWDGWMSQQQLAFTTWWDLLKEQLDDLDVTTLLNRINEVDDKVTNLNTELGKKADKTYVDTKIGDIDLALQGVLDGE